jgi:hypothetical protein
MHTNNFLLGASIDRGQAEYRQLHAHSGFENLRTTNTRPQRAETINACCSGDRTKVRARLHHIQTRGALSGVDESSLAGAFALRKRTKKTIQ